MMVEGEASQEPEAPEGAPASPPPEQTAPAVEAEAARPQEEATAEAAPEVSAEAAPAGPLLDWSHVRGFQTVEPAPEALSSREDYAEELAKELNLRAARFARSVDESIVLSSEGVIRWLGDPIARIVAGESLLQPRAVLLADEALAGEERASVETRVGLWLQAHVRKVLGPLTALAEGADLPEAARPLAAKIVEALGVLEREGVRNEVRSLDQNARGALRKLGVRFGALYIYVPLLLKPGARSLCSLLWMLRRGQEPGADRLLAFAAAGRTSFANEGLLSPDSYRVAGFRLSGERVVRVDIIERLSDLIRAAIPDYMRASSRPASDAYGFVVTPQMTSLTGCSGEAFASILRSLGFEPHKVSKAAYEAARPKAPTEPLKPAISGAPEAAAASGEAAEEAQAETGAPQGAVDESETAEAVAAAEPEAQEATPGEERQAAAEAGEAEAPEATQPETPGEQALDAGSEASESVTETAQAADSEGSPTPQEAAEAEAPVSDAGEPEAAGGDALVSALEAGEVATSQGEVDEAGTAEAIAAEEGVGSPIPQEAAGEEVEAAAPVADEEIEIWRPAPRRPRAQRPQHAPEQREARPPRERQQRRHGRPPEAAAPAEAAGEAKPQQGPRPPRPERRDEPRRFEGKGGQDNRDERRPPKNFGPRREQRPTQVDPDSPFAKLAALKPLLERRDKRP